MGPVNHGRPDDIFIDRRLVVVNPSIVGTWRRERFSLYAGVGVDLEMEHERSRRPRFIGHDEEGREILSDEIQHYNSRGIDRTVELRGGAIVSLTRRTVLRAEYSILPKYFDEWGSKSFTVGFGIRF